MSYPASPYVYQQFEGLYVAGTRVSLDSVLISFLQGTSPEDIVKDFSTLKIHNVYGAIAYYLEHQQTIDAYLAQGKRAFESAPGLSQTNPDLFARLEAARKERMSKRT